MKTKVAIVGGGPGGTATALFLARKGISSTIIEKTRFPRYHIGESLTGECGNCLRALGLEEDMNGRRHPVKYGVTVYGPGGKNSFWVPVKGWTPATGMYEATTWSVPRSDFDEMLLRGAAASGVEVIQGEAIEPLRNGDRYIGDVCDLNFRESTQAENEAAAWDLQWEDVLGPEDEYTIPIGRALTWQPGKVGSVRSTRASRVSPSSARVSGKKP